MLLALYCLLVAVGSLAGGWVPLALSLTHTRLQLALSFVGGVMLGIGLLHLVPHAFFELENIQTTVGCVLAGFLIMFFIERVFHFHHHDVVHPEHKHHGADHSQHAHEHVHTTAVPQQQRARGAAALAGLTLHSLLDGVALAAAVAGAHDHEPHAPSAGLMVFLVVILHKPFDSLTLGTMLLAAGMSRGRRHFINLIYALTVPAGVAAFIWGMGLAGPAQQTLIGGALAFAAGTFLCISTADLLPELQFHTHDRVKLSAALLLGIAISAGLVVLEESTHDHGHHESLDHQHEHPHDHSPSAAARPTSL